MYDLIDKINQMLPLYLLVFARMSGMTTTIPIIGFGTVPVRVRISLAVVFTLIIAPVLAPGFHHNFTSFLPVMFAVLGEVFLGAFIGFGTRMIFEAFAVAGAFIGYQMGMAIMNVFDPGTQEQQPIIGNFWVLIIVVFFMVTNSHYFLIGTLFQNFKMIGLMGADFSAEAGRNLIHGGSLIFDLALRFAAPTMIFLLVLDVVLAFMARVMPQLNIFFISLPLKIGAGIILLILSLDIFQTLFSYVSQELQTMLTAILRSLA